MKAKELVAEMEEEFDERKELIVKKILEDRLFELQNAKIMVDELQRQYDNLLERTVDDIFYDNDMA